MSMTGIKADMTELIVTAFGDTQTPFLARAALARLQGEWGMDVRDVAIVLRGADGNVAVQQTLSRHAGSSESSTFWDTIADLLFAPESSPGAANEAESEMCATVGIKPAFVRHEGSQIRLCESALLVLSRGRVHREKVVGMLQGFVPNGATGGSSCRIWETEIRVKAR